MTRFPKYRALFDRPTLQYYDQLVKFFPAPLKWYRYGLRFKWIRSLFVCGEEQLLPGDLLHVLARKYYMPQKVNHLLEEGYEQIIIPGAGFDPMGLFLSKKGVSCIEIDTPATALHKKRFLQTCYPSSPHPAIIPAQLDKQPFQHHLSHQQQIDPHKKTLVVAEGFFDYLPYHRVSSIFITLKSYFSHKTTILSTHFSLNELSPFHQWVYTNSVNLVGESLRFGTSINRFISLAKEQGFGVRQLVDRQEIIEDLKKQTKIDLPLLKGFYILLFQ